MASTKEGKALERALTKYAAAGGGWLGNVLEMAEGVARDFARDTTHGTPQQRRTYEAQAAALYGFRLVQVVAPRERGRLEFAAREGLVFKWIGAAYETDVCDGCEGSIEAGAWVAEAPGYGAAGIMALCATCHGGALASDGAQT